MSPLRHSICPVCVLTIGNTRSCCPFHTETLVMAGVMQGWRRHEPPFMLQRTLTYVRAGSRQREAA